MIIHLNSPALLVSQIRLAQMLRSHNIIVFFTNSANFVGTRRVMYISLPKSFMVHATCTLFLVNWKFCKRNAYFITHFS